MRRPAVRAAALLAAVALSLAMAAQARASLTAVGPTVPRYGFPEYYQDSTGLRLGLCVENGDPFCTSTAPSAGPAMITSNPSSTNFPEETFWWSAQADIDRPVGQTATIIIAQEAAFANGPVEAGQQMAFGRVRIRIDGLQPGADYTVTHPYGGGTFTANAAGVVNETTDNGCAAAPCPFGTALGGEIGPFLRWDPKVAPAAPPGYIGSPLVTHPVVGSPTGDNFFSVSGPGIPNGTMSTNLFTVEGKLAGPARPFLQVEPRAGVSFGGQLALTQGVARAVTVTNGGTAPLAVFRAGLAGVAAADFPITADGCSGRSLASGASCAVSLAFRPLGFGVRQARLGFATNATGTASSVLLTGSGLAPVVTAPSRPAPLKVTRVRSRTAMLLSTAQRSGLTIRVTVPKGAHVVRVRVLRVAKGGKRHRIAQRLFKVRPGKRVLRLKGSALRSKLTRGRYVLTITPGQSRRSLGATTTRRLQLL
jgi:hypothetical protein